MMFSSLFSSINNSVANLAVDRSALSGFKATRFGVHVWLIPTAVLATLPDAAASRFPRFFLYAVGLCFARDMLYHIV
jgi:hypothetical protein